MRRPIPRFLVILLLLQLLSGGGWLFGTAAEAASPATVLIDDDYTQAEEGRTASSYGYTLTEPAFGTGDAAIAPGAGGSGKSLHLYVSGGESNSTTKISRSFAPQTGTVTVEMSFLQPGSTMLTSSILNMYSSTGKIAARINTNPSQKAITFVPQSANTTILPYQLNTWYNIKTEINVQSQKINVWVNGVLCLSRVGPVDTGVTDISRIEFVTPVNNGGQYIGYLKVTSAPPAFPPDAPTGLYYVPRDKEIAIWWDSVTSAVYYNVKAKVHAGDPWAVTKYTKNFFPMERTSVKSINGVPLVNGSTYYVAVSQVTRDLNGNYYESPDTVLEAVPNDVIQVPSGDSSVIGSLKVYDAYYAAKWSVNSGIRTGDSPFAEGPYTITRLPAKYGGMDWIRPDIYSQKYADKPQIAVFNVRDRAAVYVAMDQRAVLPAWLTGWTDTGDVIELDGGKYALEIYRKEFTGNSPVTMGLNTAAQPNSGNLGYVVLAERIPVGLQTEPLKTWVNQADLAVTGSVYEAGVTLSVYNNRSLVYSGLLTENRFTTNVQLTPGPNRLEWTASRPGSALADQVTAVVYYDPDAPQLRLAPPPLSVKEAVYTLQGTVNEDAAVTVKNNGRLLYDRVAASVYQPFSFPVNLEEGSNKIEISAADPAGNVSTETHTVVYSFWAGDPDYYDLNGNRLQVLTPSADIVARKEIANTTSQMKEVTVLFVLYDAGHTMADHSAVSAVIPPGETMALSTGFRLPAEVSGYMLKAFIWDNLNEMHPLSGEATLP